MTKHGVLYGAERRFLDETYNLNAATGEKLLLADVITVDESLGVVLPVE